MIVSCDIELEIGKIYKGWTVTNDRGKTFKLPIFVLERVDEIEFLKYIKENETVNPKLTGKYYRISVD